MTPAARVQAAIDCLDLVLAGAPAEQILTRWARQSRFAGSKDRAAVRDHVFDALRKRRSFAALGGSDSGRGLMLGAIRAEGYDPDTVFGAGGYGPAALEQAERGAGHEPAPGAQACDFPDWLWPELVRSHSDMSETIALALSERAPVHLRVNIAATDRDKAIALLRQDRIEASAHGSANTALEVMEGARKLRQSSVYLNGLVELQDGASQAVVEKLNLTRGMRVLDFCAGGGGKSLAMAAHQGVEVFAHDISKSRLDNIKQRSERAGTPVHLLDLEEISGRAPFDVVLCDVPCSGSGAWRRAPDGKWRLDAPQLAGLQATQLEILEQAGAFVAKKGVLAFATCSVLQCENADVVKTFVNRNSIWNVVFQQQWDLSDGSDGFFSAHLKRKQLNAVQPMRDIRSGLNHV